MVEIPSESSTGDGIAKATTSRDSKDIVYAADGLKLGTRHLEEAYKGGVLTAITAPVSRNIVAGVSAAFKTGAETRKFIHRHSCILSAVLNYISQSSKKVHW